MCEFSTAQGEGQKWYLQMKNYADALLDLEAALNGSAGGLVW